MLQIRDYVDTILQVLTDHPSVYGATKIIGNPKAFEAVVAEVGDRLAKQKDGILDIIVEVEGGLVEAVQNIPAGCRVIVRDGDTDGGSSEYLVEINGEEYYQTVFEADGSMTPGCAEADQRSMTISLPGVHGWIGRSISDAETAREAAVEWQRWQSEQSMSWQDVAIWGEFFTRLGQRFGLTDEFKENGVI